MGSSSGSQTTGYKYLMGVHMGLGRGPFDEVVESRVGDRVAWSGSITDNATVSINQPDLFGGEKSEGGIVGELDVMMGGPTQVAPVGLAAMLGGIVPGFRGIVSVFFNGQICANNPYPKPWTWRRRRVMSGWDGAVWYPEKAAIWLGTGTGADGIKAMNPAHILYELYTNQDWRRGLPRARIDDASFRAAADKLYAEGFGLCLQWTRQGSVNEFKQLVLDHICAACGPDLSTGMIRLKLIRDDADPATLPLFTFDTGLLRVAQEEAAAGSTQYNQVDVRWIDPRDGQEKSAPPVKNLGSIQSTGLKPTSKEYPGLPTQDLAIRVAMRDLRVAASGLRRYKVVLDRRGYAIQSGDVFRISDPVRGITNMVLRAGRVEDSPIINGEITITAVQDVFGLPATAYVEAQPPGWVPPDTTPVAPTDRVLMEAPYFELVRRIDPANLALLTADSCFVSGIARRPTGLARNFGMATRVGAAAFVERATGDWSPTGLTTALASPGATAVTVTSGTDLDFVATGTPALWESELVRVDAINISTGALTLARGCADTVPVQHAAGTRIWFFDGTAGADPSEYLTGETVDVKMLTRTATSQLAQALAPTDSLMFAKRQARPYPPGNFKITAQAYPVAIMGDLAVSWAHRDRLLQSDQVVDTAAASVGPEAGTTYTVKVYGTTGTLIHTEAGLTGTSWTYTQAAETSDAGAYQSTLRVTLEAIRGSDTSWQKQDYTFDRAGLGLSLGKFLGGV